MKNAVLAVSGVSILLVCGAPAHAQTREKFEIALPPVAAAPADVMFFQQAAGPEMTRRPLVEHAAEFVSTGFGIDGKPVKGAPYQADAVTETAQTLADGNRISRKSSTFVARDGEGRTRREMTLGAIGPFVVAAGADTKVVYIHDPVAGVSYTLNEKDKTARKMEGRVMMVSITRDGKPAHEGVPVIGAIAGRRVPREAIAEGKIEDKIVRAEHVIVSEGPSGRIERARIPAPGAKNLRTESLGKRNIEGVEAEGTRTVHVIEAGEIGNDRPIEIVSERWYSPELQTVVMTRHSDPRIGETVYRLESLRRGEPARALFEVPAAYTMVTEQSPAIKLRREAR